MDLYVGIVLAGLAFLASLVSVELGLSAAIIEMALGVIGGNFLGLRAGSHPASRPKSCCWWGS